MKERIVKWYKMGLWDTEKIQSAVDKGFITAEDYAEITGETSA